MSKIALYPGQSIKSSSDQYYKIVSDLGSGGNSSVFIALCTSGKMKGILFSFKVFCNIEKKDRIEKFLGEIDFLEKIDHPAIIRVYDKGVFTDKHGSEYPFVVSDYYPKTLSDIMKSGASLVEKTIFTINLLSGLCYLTTCETKIIHRDIKPQNIFIKGRNAILGDFGLMKTIKKEPNIDEEIKELEVSLGAGMAFFYRTPDLVEYLNKRADVTQASDIFQLGLVIANLFTGFNPCKKAEKITDSFEMYPLGDINSKRFGGLIAQNITAMLDPNPTTRITHNMALDRWNGALETISKEMLEINGTL